MKTIHLVAKYFRELGYRVGKEGNSLRVARRRKKFAYLHVKGMEVKMGKGSTYGSGCVKVHLTDPESFDILQKQVIYCFKHTGCNWCPQRESV